MAELSVSQHCTAAVRFSHYNCNVSEDACYNSAESGVLRLFDNGVLEGCFGRIRRLELVSAPSRATGRRGSSSCGQKFLPDSLSGDVPKRTQLFCCSVQCKKIYRQLQNYSYTLCLSIFLEISQNLLFLKF